MTSLLEILSRPEIAQLIVSCQLLKEVFLLRSLGRSMKDPITKAFEVDRGVTVAHAEVMHRLGLGEPVRHRGAGPNEMEISVEFVNGVAVVPHDIVLYVPPKSPLGNAAAVSEPSTKPGLRAAAAAIKRKRNPAGRAAELTADDFVRRVAGLVATGARMSIPALEGAYEDEFKTAMLKDVLVLNTGKAKQGKKKCIQKLVTLIAEYGVSCHCQTQSYLPSVWNQWDFPRQKKDLRFFRET